jgi:carbamate kinase
MARHDLPDVPLGLLVADTEGSMGYMIEQSFQNVLVKAGIKKDVVTLVTQVLVDRHDPALLNPSKFIGRNFTFEEAKIRIEKEGWEMKSYGNSDSWRRVVGSPLPISIINARIVRQLIDTGAILITAGGGGIPVYLDEEMGLEGVDAVIDKDLAAAILAKEIDAEIFIIITNVDGVYINFGKPDQLRIPKMTAGTALEHMADGQFPAGSMGPKIKAATEFLQNGGKQAIICDIKQLDRAMENQAGTIIIP